MRPQRGVRLDEQLKVGRGVQSLGHVLARRQHATAWVDFIAQEVPRTKVREYALVALDTAFLGIAPRRALPKVLRLDETRKFSGYFSAWQLAIPRHHLLGAQEHREGEEARQATREGEAHARGDHDSSSQYRRNRWPEVTQWCASQQHNLGGWARPRH